jgi:hypothetical protein
MPPFIMLPFMLLGVPILLGGPLLVLARLATLPAGLAGRSTSPPVKRGNRLSSS